MIKSTLENKKVVFICLAIILFMVGLSFAAVPLYNIFCRVTGYGGTTQISNYVDEKFVHSDGDKVPLDLVLCAENAGGCGLLQSKHTASRELLYREYWFRSGLNESMKSALKDITKNVEQIISLTSEDLVLDIGCNIVYGILEFYFS